jgi:O-antigen ligase/tetratricopeptide (TPR) repeat protein
MNKILRYITLVGLFIIPFIPLLVANTLFFPFITGKNFGFRIIVEIVFAAWVILAVTDKAFRPKLNMLMYAFMAFVAIIGIADIVGVAPFKSFWSNYERMEGWVTLAHLFAYFIVLGTVLAKEKLWDAFWQTTLGVNAVIMLYSVLQIKGLLTINQGGVRVDATFGNATYLAIYTVFSIFIAGLFLLRRSDSYQNFKNGFLYLGFNVGFFFLMLPNLSVSALDKSASAPVYLWAFIGWIGVNLALYLTSFLKQEKVMYGLLVVFNLFVLYYTATRGAILGLIGGVFVSGLLIAIFERNNKLMRRVAIGMIATTVAIVAIFMAVRNTEFVRNSPVLGRFASISMTERTTLSRFKLWNMAIDGFKERPVLGWGQENFNYVFNEYFNPELYNQEQWFDRTHNVIFDWLIAGGILGLAAYLAVFGGTVYYIWKAKGDESFTIAEKSLLTGLLAGYFIHNLFVFDNLTSYLMYFGVVAYVYNRTTLRPERVSQPVENSVVVPVVVVAFLAIMFVVNVKPYLANRTLITALNLQQSEASGDITPNVNAFKDALSYESYGNSEIREQILSLASQAARVQQSLTGKDELLKLALEEGKKQTELTPNDARYQVFYGTYLVQSGNAKEAIPYLEKAVTLSPKKQAIIFALAGAHLNEKNFPRAQELLKTAYELEPSYVQAQLSYAASAVYNNDLKLSDQILSGLSSTTIATSDDLIQAYYTTKNYARLISMWKQRVIEEPSAQNHVSLAAAYLYANDRKNAVLEIRKAIEIEPNFKEQGEMYIKEIEAGRNP